MQRIGNLPLALQERPEDVSLYFHIPFCLRKCPYCHFFVLPDQERFKAPFLNALLQEWNKRKQQLKSSRIVSIYFGGGTPTKLPPSAIGVLLEAIASSVQLAACCEITLEANPEDICLEKMRSYAQVGVNRISLGVQSLIDKELHLLGRQHTAAEAMQAVHDCYAAGIENISIDLMYELPEQTLDSWLITLRHVQTLPLTHLSLYNLTFEPSTLFFKRRAQLEKSLPQDEERLAMLQSAVAHLEAMGLERYEISAFARPSLHSRHNTGYWLGRPFFGLGPSAFSYWGAKRFSNIAHFDKYLAALQNDQLPVDFEECLAYPSNLHELLVIQLRLLEGVDLTAFELQWGSLPQETLLILESLHRRNWLRYRENRWQLSEEGMLFYDSLAVELIR